MIIWALPRPSSAQPFSITPSLGTNGTFQVSFESDPGLYYIFLTSYSLAPAQFRHATVTLGSSGTKRFALAIAMFIKR